MPCGRDSFKTEPSDARPLRWMWLSLRPIAYTISAVLVVTVCTLAYWSAMGTMRDILFPYVKLISLDEHLWLRRIAAANVNVPVGLLGATLLSYPLVWIYERRSVLVAVLVFLPMFSLRLRDNIFYTYRAITEIAVWWEFMTVFLPLLLGVIVLRRRLQSSNLAFKRDALKRAP